MSDWIKLSRMVFPCELGIFAWERRRTQPLEVEVQLCLDLEPAAAGDLSCSVDYSAIYEQVRFLARHGRWRLIESLAFALVRHLLAVPCPAEARRRAEAVVVELSKPEALQGRAVPHVRVERTRAWADAADGVVGRGAVTITRLVLTDEAGAYHVDVAPGATWDAPKGARGYLVAGSLECDGRPLAAREEFEPGAHRITNPGATEARLLVLAFPPLGVTALH